MNEPELRERLFDLAGAAPAGRPAPPQVLRRARRRVVFTIAWSVAIVVLVIGVGIAGLRALQATRGRPAGDAERTDRSVKTGGWILYQDGAEFIAVDPEDPESPVSLGPSHSLDPVASSADGSRLLLDGRKDDDLYVLEADGTRLRLTRAGTDGFPGSFSPDGERVVFAGNHELQVVNLSRGTARRFIPYAAATMGVADPAWSPDGSSIAFIQLEDVGETSWGEPIYQRTLWVVSIDGAGRRMVMDLGREDRSPTGWATELAWSPDGSRFVFSSADLEGGGKYQIFVVNADGSGLRRLTSDGLNQAPAWSPDGSRIAFACGSSLCTMTANGTDVREIGGATPKKWSRITWTTSLDPLT